MAGMPHSILRLLDYFPFSSSSIRLYGIKCTPRPEAGYRPSSVGIRPLIYLQTFKDWKPPIHSGKAGANSPTRRVPCFFHLQKPSARHATHIFRLRKLPMHRAARIFHLRKRPTRRAAFSKSFTMSSTRRATRILYLQKLPTQRASSFLHMEMPSAHRAAFQCHRFESPTPRADYLAGLITPPSPTEGRSDTFQP